MKSDNAQRLNIQTIPSLQQELNDFVLQTKQRLQELAGTLSAYRDCQQPAAMSEPTSNQAIEQPLAMNFQADLQEPQPALSSYENSQTSTNQFDIDEADPLARLKAIKQRLAARIDHQDASN